MVIRIESIVLHILQSSSSAGKRTSVHSCNNGAIGDYDNGLVVSACKGVLCGPLDAVESTGTSNLASTEEIRSQWLRTCIARYADVKLKFRTVAVKRDWALRTFCHTVENRLPSAGGCRAGSGSTGREFIPTLLLELDRTLGRAASLVSKFV
eukprot:m.318130 g.318130  ORF g.318130 m.318130 type:complete len:152 (+) comp27568_c0_seq2:1272-1727(+)